MSPSQDPWDRRADEFGKRPWYYSLKVGLGLMLLFFVLGFAGLIIGGVFDWGKEGRRITGPDNTREQYTEIIRDKTDMDAAMGNICSIRRSKTSTTSTDDPLLIENPSLAYEGTYRRAKADYDRRMENAFEGGLIKKYTSLGDEERFPNPAPSLEERIQTDCAE